MKIFLVCIICFIPRHCFPYGIVSLLPKDTSTPRVNFKINNDAFLSAYGRDDSSKALINFYFHRRLRGIRFFSMGAPVATAGAIGMDAVAVQLNDDNKIAG